MEVTQRTLFFLRAAGGGYEGLNDSDVSSHFGAALAEVDFWAKNCGTRTTQVTIVLHCKTHIYIYICIKIYNMYIYVSIYIYLDISVLQVPNLETLDKYRDIFLRKDGPQSKHAVLSWESEQKLT